MANGRSPVARWFYENQVLGWLGVLAGVASLLASPILGWTTAAGLTTLIVGGIIVGAAIAAWFLQPSKYPLDCIECLNEYELEGPRGAKATRLERMRFLAKATIPAFVYAMRKSDGTPTTRELRYRNLGRGAKESTPWFKLGNNHVFVASSPGLYSTVTVQPPTPINRGDVIECEDHLVVVDGFPSSDEHVGKTLLYPTKILKMEVTFSGCQIENCLGTRFELMPVDGRPLTVEPIDGKLKVKWHLEGARPKEAYRISWRWM